MVAFPCPPPLDTELLRKYNFFQLYVPDGGGNFIMKELFGGFEDSVITDKLLHTDMMQEFGGMEALDFHRFEKWRSIEKSCWLNRFYFLVPMARMAWLNRDRALGRIVVHVMQSFFRRETPPVGKAALKEHWQRVARRMEEDYNSRSHEEIVRDETDVEYIWYDMQVGQRLYCFFYASFFVWGLIAEEEKGEILEGLKLHARVIADQESFQKPYLDNHQSVRAAALWWALPLLKDEPDYAEIHSHAKHLCEWHVMNEFLSSGMLFENSPSYHAFVVWHGRDFLNLSRRRGEEISPEVQERFNRAGGVLACCGRPDGKSLTVNDSYSYDALPLMESLGTAAAKSDFTVIRPGGLAIASCGDIYAAMDVSSFIGKFSHYHGGKNSLVLLWKGIPFLEETGCPSYDRPEFPLCKRSDYHSTLLVNGTGDSHAFGLYGFDGWADMEYGGQWEDCPEGKSFSSVLISNVPEWKGIAWRRTLIVKKNGVRIVDQITGNAASRPITLLFCLAPDVTAVQKANGFLLASRGEQGMLSIGSGEAVLSIETICNCRQTEPRGSLRIQAEFEGRNMLECISELRFSADSGM